MENSPPNKGKRGEQEQDDSHDAQAENSAALSETHVVQRSN
jgi:hypothetical protein